MSETDNQKDNKAWDTLWVHVNLATMTGEGYGIIENAAIAFHDGNIVWMGSFDSLPGKQEELANEVIEAGHIWLTPGLVDCHTHLVYAGTRADEFAQRLQGKSYADIAKAGGGILSTVRATRAASPEDLYKASQHRLWPYMQQGVTTIEIKSGYGLDIDTELKMLAVARELEKNYSINIMTTFLGAHAVPPEFAGNIDGYVDFICNEMLPAVADSGMADAVDGYCESIGFTPAHMAKIFDVAKRYNLPLKLHSQQLSDSGGAELAAKYKAMSADHLEYLSEGGVKALAEAGTVAVLLPGAFYALRETQKPPVELLRKYHVPMALGTDCNPGTSPTCSLPLMMNMACMMFGLSPVEALQAVTKNGAHALGLAHRIGTLEVGKMADLAVWDIAHPDEISYYFGFNPCIGIIKNGFFLVSKE